MNASRFDFVLRRGVAAQHAHRYTEAEACFREALAIAPNDPEVISLLGLSLTHGDGLEEGTQLLERAVQLDPRQPGLRFNLVDGLVAGQDYGRALGVLHTVLDSDPGNLQAWLRAGDIAQLQGDVAGAVEAWNRAHDAHPAAAAPRNGLAILRRLDAAATDWFANDASSGRMTPPLGIDTPSSSLSEMRIAEREE